MTTHRVEIYGDETPVITVPVVDDLTGDPIDLTGATIQAHIDLDDGTFLTQWNVALGLEIGTVVLSLTPAKLALMREKLAEQIAASHPDNSTELTRSIFGRRTLRWDLVVVVNGDINAVIRKSVIELFDGVTNL